MTGTIFKIDITKYIMQQAEFFGISCTTYILRVTTLTSRVEISDEEECGLSEVLTKLKEFGALPR